MTPEQQRIAIAEACGWTLYYKGAIRADGHRSEVWGKPPHEALPDYLNDLNAMHEAEKVIRERADRVDSYLDQLDGAMSGVHATAAQRAEAFLKTLNLWKP